MPVDSREIAERVMYELLGHRWVWPAITATDRFEAVQQRIHLPGRPVISVENVTVGGRVIEGYEIENRATLKLPDTNRRLGYFWGSSGWTWSGVGRLEDILLEANRCQEVEVTYTYGSPPPLAVKTAIDRLQCELDLAFNGDPDGECRLPARVTSVSRQGIDMTLIDAQDFLNDGRTGITEVDLVIRTFNPSKAKARARVYSADYRPARRLSSGS